MIKTAGLMLMLLFTLGTAVKCFNPKALNSPTSPSNTFEISRDSVRADIDGNLARALLIHDKYYAFYEVRSPISTQSIKKFYIIQKNGKIEREIKVPPGISDEYYYKLYYWGGRIIVNTEFYKNTYYLDERKGEFIKDAKITEVPLFEDESYMITSACHGEFGSTIYFKNKQTLITDSAHTGCPVQVHKLANKYIINTSDLMYHATIEIDDPLNLRASAKIVFENNNFNSHFYMPASFVANGILYHIYNSYHKQIGFDEKKERIAITNDTVKIGTVNNAKFKPVCQLDDRINIELQQQLSPNYEICTFHTEERVQIGLKKDIPPYREGKYGFIEIINNKIKIHYFISKKSA